MRSARKFSKNERITNGNCGGKNVCMKIKKIIEKIAEIS